MSTNLIILINPHKEIETILSQDVTRQIFCDFSSIVVWLDWSALLVLFLRFLKWHLFEFHTFIRKVTIHIFTFVTELHHHYCVTVIKAVIVFIWFDFCFQLTVNFWCVLFSVISLSTFQQILPIFSQQQSSSFFLWWNAITSIFRNTIMAEILNIDGTFLNPW